VKAVVALSLAVTVFAGLAGASAKAPPVPSFRHAIVVVLENKNQSEVLGNSDAPEFNALAAGGAVLSNYRGLTHPSLPNYLALVSGSTHGIASDCTSCRVSGRSLADTLQRAGRTWKTYAEGIPSPGFTGPFSGQYAKKHVPFLYFRDIVSSRARRRHVVGLGQLSRDLAANRLPTFSLVVPNLCHDMHSCSVATGDAWLGSFMKPLLRSPHLGSTVVFVVFDEPEESEAATGRIPAIALGPLVRAGARDSARTSHYGLLRTLEDAWRLPRLGRSASTLPITGIWR
jgi:hypothetical protein